MKYDGIWYLSSPPFNETIQLSCEAFFSVYPMSPGRRMRHAAPPSPHDLSVSMLQCWSFGFIHHFRFTVVYYGLLTHYWVYRFTHVYRIFFMCVSWSFPGATALPRWPCGLGLNPRRALKIPWVAKGLSRCRNHLLIPLEAGAGGCFGGSPITPTYPKHHGKFQRRIRTCQGSPLWKYRDWDFHEIPSFKAKQIPWQMASPKMRGSTKMGKTQWITMGKSWNMRFQERLMSWTPWIIALFLAWAFGHTDHTDHTDLCWADF